jgi:hypothetical protein
MEEIMCDFCAHNTKICINSHEYRQCQMPGFHFMKTSQQISQTVWAAIVQLVHFSFVTKPVLASWRSQGIYFKRIRRESFSGQLSQFPQRKM